MSAILTVRLDEDLKRRGTEVLRRQGFSPSSAVQKLFAYVVAHDELPFPDKERPSKDQIRQMVTLLDSFHTADIPPMSDVEIRDARLEERYGSRS